MESQEMTVNEGNTMREFEVGDVEEQQQLNPQLALKLNIDGPE